MNILHINTVQEGGAAWCARRINKALVQQGIESRMLFAEGNCMPNGIDGAIAEKDSYLWDKNWLLLKFRHFINRMPWVCDADKWRYDLTLAQENAGTSLYLHHPRSQYINIAHHPLVEWADIIHLHWVTEFVDYPTFFKAVKKPIVWTLHDKYPAVGLEHYCCRYSALPESLMVLNKKCINIKRNGILHAKNLQIVAISEQMKSICSESEVLNGIPCQLIHNGVNSDIFKPTNQTSFTYIIPTNATVFLFSAYDIWDDNKGLVRVLNALEKVQCKNKALIVIGNSNGKIPTASFPIICTGLVNNQIELARLYSIADYFIQASYEETFAQTPLEAMACGTPVISTPCSGASDLINSTNGVVCSDYDCNALVKGIIVALQMTFDREIIRKYIVDNYDYAIIAKKYIDLYKSLLANN